MNCTPHSINTSVCSPHEEDEQMFNLKRRFETTQLDIFLKWFQSKRPDLSINANICSVSTSNENQEVMGLLSNRKFVLEILVNLNYFKSYPYKDKVYKSFCETYINFIYNWKTENSLYLEELEFSEIKVESSWRNRFPNGDGLFDSGRDFSIIAPLSIFVEDVYKKDRLMVLNL